MATSNEQPGAVAGKVAAGMSDEALRAAWQRTTGEPGDPEADALLAEIARRNLDI